MTRRWTALSCGFAWVLLLASLPHGRADDSFLISYWWGPTSTDEAMARLAEANFTVAVCGEGRAALDLAHKHGLKVIVMDPRLTAHRVGESGFEAGLDEVVADFSAHPALWGYFITDEPNAAQFENLGAINRQLLKQDPQRVPFINLFPTYASPQQLGNATYDEHVREYLRIVQPKLLSYDHYALMQDGERPDYFENLEIVRRAGLEHSTPFAYVLLSVPHFSYRDPNEADLRWQVNTALAYGARGVIYFTYVSPPETKDYEGWGEAIVTTEGQPTAKFAIVKRINAELKALGPTLMRLTSTAVFHSQPVPQGAQALPANDLVAGVTGGPLIVGHLLDQSGQRYAMFVNRSPRDATDVTITFAKPVKLAEISTASGGPEPVTTTTPGAHTIWSTHFAAGQGRLVKID